MIQKEQPAKGVLHKHKRFKTGSKSSVTRLQQLYFDPIEELVKKYREIEEEIAYQQRMRAGTVIELTSTGKVRAYRAEIHHALYDKLIKVGESLVRYKYGRVPELQNEKDNAPPSFIVNLTSKGDQYIINEPPLLEDNSEDEFEDD